MRTRYTVKVILDPIDPLPGDQTYTLAANNVSAETLRDAAELERLFGDMAYTVRHIVRANDKSDGTADVEFDGETIRRPDIPWHDFAAGGWRQ